MSIASHRRVLQRQRSLKSRFKLAAARCGCTAKRASSVQTKFRIIVSLIQVVGQLGIVFSIPYPPLYSELVKFLGIFSLDLIEVMPLECFGCDG